MEVTASRTAADDLSAAEPQPTSVDVGRIGRKRKA